MGESLFHGIITCSTSAFLAISGLAGKAWHRAAFGSGVFASFARHAFLDSDLYFYVMNVISRWLYFWLEIREVLMTKRSI